MGETFKGSFVNVRPSRLEIKIGFYHFRFCHKFSTKDKKRLSFDTLHT